MEELRIDKQICGRCGWDSELFIQVHGWTFSWLDIRIRHEGCIDALRHDVREMFWDKNEIEPRESAEISRDSARAMLNDLLSSNDRKIEELKEKSRNIAIALGAIDPLKG